jgi:MFS family permease
MTDLPPDPDSVPSALEAPDTSMRALLRQNDFLFFWAARFVSTLAVQIQGVTIGWQVYVLARETGHSEGQGAFLLGMVGLAQFIPLFLLALTAGETADRHDRKVIMTAAIGVDIFCAAALGFLAWSGHTTLWPIFAIAVLFGAGRAFLSPASSAMGPMLVPRPLLPRAIAWNSLSWQSASIIGPALGGLLIAVSTATAFGTSVALFLVAGLLLLGIKGSTKPVVQPGSRWTLIKEGLVYTWRNKIVFGSISLDLFAVLLGGATALLPVFARDVLHVGPDGFGMLRAAPAVGATLVAIYLASHQIRRRAGMLMFGAVAVFAIATIVFGLSKLVWLSVGALAVLGAADMVSVYIRQTLVQLVTPDPMRGRVAAVSGLFISASNELGEFESGVAARFLGPVGAAVFGGVGALIVTGAWARMFPALRKADRLE